MRHWLMKSEPDVFGIDDLRRAKRRTTGWDGVRNYQARNMMRDDMRAGDLVFFYHSNCEEPGIVGIMKVVGEARPDPTQFDPEDPHFDPKSERKNPRWLLVDLKFERKLRRCVTLAEMREHPALAEMPLLRRGNRLSVMPVSAAEWKYVLRLEERAGR